MVTKYVGADWVTLCHAHCLVTLELKFNVCWNLWLEFLSKFQPDDDSEDRCPPPSHCAESPPCRYHTTTKTIRRNNHRGTGCTLLSVCLPYLLLAVFLFLSPVRPSLPTLLLEDQLPEHVPPPTNTHSETSTHSETNTPSSSVKKLRQADWLLRDFPYSEGIAEHKQGGTCWDCLHFHGDDSSDLPVSPKLHTYTEIGDKRWKSFLCMLLHKKISKNWILRYRNVFQQVRT